METNGIRQVYTRTVRATRSVAEDELDRLEEVVRHTHKKIEAGESRPELLPIDS
jgi:hypothetical protein